MLPKEISEALPGYKNTSTRILVSVLIMAIMFISGSYIKLALRDNSRSDREEIKCEEEKQDLRNKVAALEVSKDSLVREIKNLWIERVESQKAFKNSLKEILNDKK